MIIGVASADYQRRNASVDGEEHWGGSGWARLGQYVDHWRKAGHTVHVGTLWAYQGKVRLSVDDGQGDHEFFDPEVFFMQRLMNDQLASVMHMGQANGQLFINDVDDWYWGLDPRNEAWWHSHPKNADNKGRNRANYAAVLNASDRLTVSTPYLADRIKGMAISPMDIIPNYVDINRFDPVVQRYDPVVGWVGSTSHRSGDLEMLQGILSQMRDQVRFMHAGHADWSPPFYKKVGLEEHEVLTLDRVNAERYPELMQMDIGLVPLRDAPFNHAKSAIKGLEYAAAGIPFISSPSASYSALRAEWGDIVPVAKNGKEWIKHLRALLPFERRFDVQQQLLDAVQAYDILVGAQQTLDFIGTLT